MQCAILNLARQHRKDGYWYFSIYLLILVTIITTVALFDGYEQAFIWMLFCLCISGSIHIFFYGWNNYPPGPKPLPFFGNSLFIDLHRPSKTFASWAKQYGNVYTVWLPDPIVVVTCPDAFIDVLLKFICQERCFEREFKRELFTFAGSRWSCIMENIAPNGLFLVSSDLLKRCNYDSISGRPLPSLVRADGNSYKCIVIRNQE